MLRSLLVALMALLTLSACADLPRRGDTGWRITLLRPLEIGPGEASARLQYGRVVPRNGVQEVDPHCIFEIDTVAGTPRTVAPASFRVSEIWQRVETTSGMPVLPWHHAGLWRDRGPSQVYYVTQFWLAPDNGATARALVCQHDQASAGIGIPRHLTLGEMRQAVGEFFRIEPVR